MTPSTTTSAPVQRSRYRWRTALTVCATLAIVLCGGCCYLSWAEEREFLQTLAETDRLDPGWRLEDIDRARAVIADEENAAIVVRDLRRAYGGVWFDWLAAGYRDPAPPENVPLDAEFVAALEKHFKPYDKAIALGSRLADLPRGRCSPWYDPVSASSTESIARDMRAAVMFLNDFVILAAHHGDDALAIAYSRSALNAARSAGDEPILLALLMRSALLEIPLHTLQRALALTVPPAAELEKVQHLLEREIDEPRLTIAMRGERAVVANMIEAVQDGRLRRSALLPAANSKWPRWVADWVPRNVTLNRANELQAMNDLVEASKLPVEQQLSAIMEKIDFWEERGVLMVRAARRTASAHTRNQAKLRSAMVALAVERYGQAHAAWPASLDGLVRSGLLKAVPVDPYDGQPLRYRRLPEGVVIYSVGVDGIDDGGAIDRPNPIGPGSDIGFRLWNLESRRKTVP
jgi:hypothetical protein